jgi:hypothetical protein
VPDIPKLTPPAAHASSTGITGGHVPSLSAVAPSGRVSTPKRSAREAWADWRVTGAEADATAFCDSVLPWMEGTSAALARPLWPKDGVRPTLIGVQAKLRKALGRVLAEEADYVDALGAARQRVAQELRVERAADAAG